MPMISALGKQTHKDYGKLKASLSYRHTVR